MANRLDSIDSGSNYRFGDKLQVANPPRSLFDLSHRNTLTISNAGLLVPICVMETVPGDSFDLSVNSIIRVLPQVVPLMSHQRLYVHAFYSRIGDLWKNASTFMTKGYSGTTEKSIPVLHADTIESSNLDSDGKVLPGSTLDYMGIPIGLTASQIANLKVNALPFMMHARIWRDYFCNRNLTIDDRGLLPDDDSDFRLNDDGYVQSMVDSSKASTILTVPRYRDFADDRFTSALPFLQRGTQSSLSIDSSLDFSAAHFAVRSSAVSSVSTANVVTDGTYAGALSYTEPSSSAGTYGTLLNNWFVNELNKGTVSNIGISLNELRSLAINQTELERMAKTDGSYGEFGLTFFGKRSKNAVDYRPQYIGGTYQSINFSEVLSTAMTTSTVSGSSVNTPVGSMAGHGFCSVNGSLGHVDCDDYGYIMIVASIMPDTYYSQGLSKMYSRSSQADMFLPGRTKTGMVPILNKELYISGSTTKDNGLFAYNDPFDELRYLPNEIHGKIADSSNASFFPWTQSRYFTSTPTYSKSFCNTMNNIRKDYLYAPTEDAYIMDCQIGIRAVRPLPYMSIPAQII